MDYDSVDMKGDMDYEIGYMNEDMNDEVDDISNTEFRCSEEVSNPGGIKYDLVLLSPKQKALPFCNQKRYCYTLFTDESDIMDELKAAEERRESLEAQKISFAIEQVSHVNEVKQKRKECDDLFKQRTRQSLEQKMEHIEEKRETIIKSIQSRVRNHFCKVEMVREFSPNKSEYIMQKLQKKIESARKVREANYDASTQRLKKYEQRIAMIKEKKMKDQEMKKERINKKLDMAAEKRRMKMEEIKNKTKERLQNKKVDEMI